DRLHLGRNDAQVLRHNRQITQRIPYGSKDFHPRSLDPAPVDRCGFSGRDLPIRLEAATLINAPHVEELKDSAKPFDPPAVTRFTKLRPVVDGISPKLPGRTEIIWRNSSHFLWISALIE